jgi:septal ring factor EnvC (AmiA/AmiB activator)
MLTMKQKLQLMVFVQGMSTPLSAADLVTKAAEYVGCPVNTADIKEACKNAEIKYSQVCATASSPVSVLHNRVSAVEAENVKLRTQLADMKSDLNDMKHQMRTMKDKLSPLRVE